MSTMTKVFIVLNSVVAIVLSCLTVATAARWSNLSETINRYQELAQSSIVHRFRAESVMATNLAMKDDALREKAQLLAKQAEKVSDLTNELATARNDLARRTNEAVAAEAGRKKLEEILAVNVAELTSTQKQNQVLLTQSIDLQTRNQRLSARVLEITGNLTIATDEIRNLQEKLYAEQQRAKELQQALASGARRVAPSEPPSGAVPVTPVVAGPIRGEVVEVDGRYVSLNVGETSGVATGMTFMVRRGQTYIGDVKVESVRPKEAGGKVVMVAPGQEVRRGDQVRYPVN